MWQLDWNKHIQGCLPLFVTDPLLRFMARSENATLQECPQKANITPHQCMFGIFKPLLERYSTNKIMGQKKNVFQASDQKVE